MSARSTLKYGVIALAILALACAVVAAQVKTETSQQKGTATSQVTVERGEVVYVSGNDVVVKMESGEIRHVTAREGATATVDGKTITIKDLKPGMKLERTITTVSTPKTVKTVRAGTGTVLNVSPPTWVTVRFEDNSVERYRIPKGTTFTINGEKKTAFELKPGMKISATRIIEAPVVEVSEQRSVSGTAPAPVPVEAPPLEGALLIAEAKPAPAPAPEPAAAAPAPAPAPEPAPKKLPTTGSVVPLIGLLGLGFSGASFAVRLLRRS